MKLLRLKELALVNAMVLGSLGAFAQGTINTIAGTGFAGSTGDGGAAAAAQLAHPEGVGVDVFGNVYIADKYNSKIRVISGTTGVINTFAGTGIPGLSGLGGDALSAQMIYPNSIFIDGDANVFFTDWFNDMAMMVDRHSHHMHGHCGDGHQGYEGDGKHGDSARMELPHGIVADRQGNTYIADAGNNRIRKVDATTGLVSTYANFFGRFGYHGDGGSALGASFSAINGIAIDDRAGILYISDAGNHVVRAIDMTTGTITTVAGNGTTGYTGDGHAAIGASLNYPSGLFVDASGNLYIADAGSNVVRMVSSATGNISTIAGNGSSGFSGDGGLSSAAELNEPSAVWVDGANAIYIADAGNNRIRKITPVVTTSYASGTRTVTGSAATAVTTTTSYESGSTAFGGHAIATKPQSGPAVVAGQNSVYPNPSTGALYIALAKEVDNGVIVVEDMVGNVVYKGSVSGKLATVDLNVANGIYLLSIQTTDGVYNQKVTIAK